jgi:hypothetical protein
MSDQTNNHFDFLINDAYYRRQREISTQRIQGLDGTLPDNYVQPSNNWNSAAAGEGLVTAMAMLFASGNQNKSIGIERFNQIATEFDNKSNQVRGAIQYAKLELKSQENLAELADFENLFEQGVIPRFTNFMAGFAKLMLKGKIARGDKFWGQNIAIPADLVRSYEKGAMIIELCDISTQSVKFFKTNQKYLQLCDWQDSDSSKDKNLTKAVDYLFDQVRSFEDELDVAISKFSDLYHDSTIDCTRLEKAFIDIKKDVDSLAAQIK